VLGVSADWDRTKFTMDPDMSRAVRESFVRLYEEGLIYRDTRLVHWDCDAQTVLSNLEVENEPAQGELYQFAYEVIDPSEGGPAELVVATTRPETMLGDTAVAVHPDDPRYASLHGKFLRHPFVDREIPIICDGELVDMAFGTGAVKVTPAHDWNDFATGKRHKLAEINILTTDGKMNELCGKFAGLDRFVARKAVKKALDEVGLARGSKQHELVLPKSERSGSIVEPMISTQWFVKTKPLAEPALEAVRSGQDGHRARGVDEDLRALDDQHPRLVHLAPALVGAPHPGLLLWELQACERHPRGDALGLREMRLEGARPGRRRARHLVLERALALRDARLAREDALAREVLPRERSRDGLRHPLLLGRPHDDDGHPLHG
jgi:valyl-tRNA synthetase